MRRGEQGGALRVLYSIAAGPQGAPVPGEGFRLIDPISGAGGPAFQRLRIPQFPDKERP